MKKLLFSILIVSIFFTAQAGYMIRGIYTVPPVDLKNYTLTFNENGEPVAAASVIDHAGIHSIVIVNANSNAARIFHADAIDGVNLPVEVRDFHCSKTDEQYVLCGYRGTAANRHAFVATVDMVLSVMLFMEYPEADVFYSIWADDIPPTATHHLDYYVCGKEGYNGVIASVDRTTLRLTHTYKAVNWEYHKIILKENILSFVASGRNPDCTQIGFTEFYPRFNSINSSRWPQATEPTSLCVVSDDALGANRVILASSNLNIVTLNPVTLPASFSVPAYHFALNTSLYRYCVQDIETIVENFNTHISVAGYMIRGSQHQAWYGYTLGLSATSIMRNNNYYKLNEQYEHYKIRYHGGRSYTGGFFQDNNGKGVLFATPEIMSDCDNPYLASNTSASYSTIPFTISEVEGNSSLAFIGSEPYPMDFGIECPPFKGEEPALKPVMSAENESEIATSYDRITLKDIPANTGYQIYNTIGQLISTGVTTPDISTASLSKGVYILRLESGKTFKFVK